MNWSSVSKEASEYLPTLQALCPQYVEEMRGLATGAGVDFLDILALNVRTEITFGLFTADPGLPVKIDGCTSVSIKTRAGISLLAQNWDWQKEQAPNLVICHISRPGTSIPRLSMVTEAGVIGKIGLNEHGVGVCLNAIRARGVDRSKLPVHLGLRAVLESTSRAAAVEFLTRTGIAASAHILIADETGATGLECTANSIQELHMDDSGLVVHSNHLLLDHPDADEPVWLQDSPPRVARLRQLIREKFVGGHSLGTSELFEMFKDEEGYPGAINRCQVDGCETETLFNIIMELAKRRATVSFGRPTKISECIQLTF